MVYDLAFRGLNGNHIQCHGFYVHVSDRDKPQFQVFLRKSRRPLLTRVVSFTVRFETVSSIFHIIFYSRLWHRVRVIRLMCNLLIRRQVFTRARELSSVEMDGMDGFSRWFHLSSVKEDGEYFDKNSLPERDKSHILYVMIHGRDKITLTVIRRLVKSDDSNKHRTNKRKCFVDSRR